ncbi:MOSC domain-containing protein [Granulicella arctica]|uniref:MOSC domain-containing protein n=1 Tax=Granulicella arctica TaxID=940613 RepID=UPI0037BFAA30
MLRVSGSERRDLLRYRASTGDTGVIVVSPAGSVLSVHDTNLLHDLPTLHTLTLTRSSLPQTDCRPLALISTQTIQHLSSELGHFLAARRFRANFYLDAPAPFAEDRLVGKTIRLGSDAVIRLTERDPRCRFITLNPDSTEPFPELM